MHLVFILSRSPERSAAFSQLLQDQQDPASPQFHQWLSPAQVGDLYGPTQQDIEAFTTWLESQGLYPADISPSRLFITVPTTSGVAKKALSTEFGYFRLGSETRFAATNEPSLPAGLAVLVQSISGLADLPVHPMHHSLSPTNSLAGSDLPQFTSGSGAHYLTPGDFTTIFDLQPAYSAGLTGGGTKIAVIGRSRVYTSDLTQFETLTGIAPNLPNVVIPPLGADPGIASNGDQVEATLDLERVFGTAPGAQADLVISSIGTNGIYAAAQYEVNTLLDPIMTISFGSCEVTGGLSGVTQWDTLFSQAASEGISVFVSSGDSGAAMCDGQYTTIPASQVRSINYICASSYATCVGGTEFAENGNTSLYWTASNTPTLASAQSYIPEGAWNEPTSGSTFIADGTGGGASVYIAKPTWQTGVGVPADSARDVPDLSFPSAGHDGYFICNGGGTCSTSSFSVIYGTSAAAPSMAAMMAIIDQKLGAKQGNFNPAIYKIAASTTNGVFHDATVASSGIAACVVTTPSLCNNSTPSATSLTGGLAGYLLTSGFDLATGWGSFDLGKMLTVLGTTYQATSATLVESATSVTTAQTVTLTATVASSAAGTPTGTVQFYGNGVALAASPIPLPASGKAVLSLTFPAIGTYSLVASYSGDSTFSGSSATASLSVTSVSNVASVTTLAGSASSVTTQQTAGFTATLASGSSLSTSLPTGTVQFYNAATPLGSPVAVAAGKATYPMSSFAAGSYAVTAAYLGDTTYSGSTSPAALLTVTAVASTSALAGTASAIAATGTASFSVTVAAAAGASGTPTGTAQFLLDGVARGAALALTSGSATLPAATFPAGLHTIAAQYSGDSIFASSTTSSLSLAVGPLASMTKLGGVPQTIVDTGQTNVTATVTGTGAALPTGTIAFTVAGSAGAPAVVTTTLAGGLATLAAPLAAGTYTVSAAYSGDAGNTASTSTSGIVVSTISPTVMALTVPALITNLTPVQFTVTLTGLGVFPTATPVVFTDGITVLGSAPIVLTSTGATTSTGSASLPALYLTTIGSHAIKASFAGDANYAGSSAATSVTVNSFSSPSFSVSASPSSLVFGAGSASGNVATLRYTSVSGFTDTLLTACTVAYTGAGTVTYAPTCTISTPSLLLPAGGATSDTVTIGTTAPHAVTGGTSESRGATGAAGLGVAALLLALLPRRRLARGLAIFCTLSGLGLLAAGLTGCGSASSASNSTAVAPAAPLVGTTTGVYTITIVTTNYPGITAGNATISLTVQ